MLTPVGCLDARALAGLADELQGPSHEVVDAHLDACEGCRSLVAAYALVARDESGERANDVELSSGPTHDASDEALSPTVPSSAATATLAEGALVGGRYVLERVVGEGGMGVVWAARDAFTGRPVAIKLLKGAAGDLCRRFERETRLAATLVHPNIVEVRAILSLPDGRPALVMDLLRGRSLATELAARGALPTAEVTALLRPLVAAVYAAHLRGVIHRDLKPANVFLAEDETDGGEAPVVTLLDFGLAKLVATDEAAADKLTRTGALLGTPRYMAPEQLLGEGASKASDVWSIGVIAFECITGERPLEGKTLGALVRAVTLGKVRALPPETPLAATVNAMLAIDPAARPSLVDVHAALDALR